MSKVFDIHVLLTGPSRGYVKKQLSDNNITFTHHFIKDFKKLPEYYSILDLYLMTSREEGGPKSIIECISMDIPFVATKVGIAFEISKFSKSSNFCEVDDVTELVSKSTFILQNLNNFKLDIKYDIIENHDFDNIVKQFLKIYNQFNYKYLS